MCVVCEMRSVRSTFNRNVSTVNSVLKCPTVFITSTYWTVVCYPCCQKTSQSDQIWLMLLLIHIFRGCPCLHLRHGSGVSPCRFQGGCQHFPCSPHPDPLTLTSSWDVARGLSVLGPESSCFPTMVSSLKARTAEQSASQNGVNASCR